MNSDQEELAPGTLVAQRYRVVENIGAGGMGAVYEAVQEGLGRRVALKVLRAGYAEDEEAVARFQREAQASASLGHPNIVTVTDFGSDHGRLFMVMERLYGASLAKVLANERALSARRSVWIASQALSALSAAHRAGIIHRDMKPDNVFLTEVSGVRDVVKVLDFGIARFTDSQGNSNLTNTGAVLGTPAYMSPEQARGRSVDARSDVYSVGVLLYEMLSGRQPFVANNYHALLFAILEETPPSLATLRADLPPPLVATIERAMAKDVHTRFQSADELRAALAPWMHTNGPVDAYGATAELPQVPQPQLPSGLAPPVTAAAAQSTAAPFSVGGAGSMFSAIPSPAVAAKPPPSAPSPAPFAPPPLAPRSATSPAIWLGLAVLVVTSIGAAFSVRRAWSRSQRAARATQPVIATSFPWQDASFDIDAALASYAALSAQLADASQVQQAMAALAAQNGTPADAPQPPEVDPADMARAFERALQRNPRGADVDTNTFIANNMHRRPVQSVFLRSSASAEDEARVRNELTNPSRSWSVCGLLSERLAPDLAARGWTYTFDVELGPDGRVARARAADAFTRQQFVASVCFQGMLTQNLRLARPGSDVRSMTVVFANRYAR